MSNNIKLTKPIVCIIDDDGTTRTLDEHTGMTSWLNNRNIPMDFAICYDTIGTKGKLTVDKLQELQAAGNEIIVHGNTKLQSMQTINDVYNELTAAQNFNKQYGFNDTIYVYPEGLNSDNVLTMDEVKQTVGTMFTYGLNVNIKSKSYDDTKGVWNKVPLEDKLDIARMEVSDTKNLATHQAKIDKCIENNGLLILFTHSFRSEFSTTGIQNFKEIIEYLESNDVEFLTTSQAFEKIEQLNNGYTPEVSSEWINIQMQNHQGNILHPETGAELVKYKASNVNDTLIDLEARDELFISDTVPDNDGLWVDTSDQTVRPNEENPVVTQVKKYINDNLEDVNSQLDSIEKIKKFRYAMFTFEAKELNDKESKLVILLSNDGIVWEHLDIDYISPNLRDPFCFIKGEYYYITATNLVTNNNITYLRSKDLIHFEEITTPYTGLSAYSSIWSPSVFKFNNDYYMTVSLSVNNSDIYGMNQYVTKLDSNLIPTTWNKVNIIGNATSVYDGHFIATDKKIYMYYKNTQVGYEGVEIACSDTIDGDFNIIGKIETDNKKEAPFLFLVNDKLRLYLDTYEGEGGISYKDMFYDLGYNKPIITKNMKKYKHCNLIDLSGWNWETNYNLEGNFIYLNDANDLTITIYNRRSVNPNTLNLPSNLSSDEKYGKVSLYEQGGGNLSQELHLLNNRHFYRNYVSGSWNSWVEVLKDTDVTNIVLKPEISVGGGVDINVLNVNGNKIVNIQGNLTNIDKSTTVQNLFTIDSKYKTKKNITINSVNINNWDDKHPLIELKTDGKINILIPSGSLLEQSNYVFFNVTYVI